MLISGRRVLHMRELLVVVRILRSMPFWRARKVILRLLGSGHV